MKQQLNFQPQPLKKFTIPTWVSILIIIIAALLAIALILRAAYWNVGSVLIEFPKNHLTDKTANWQTYHNEEYGFEMRYPEDWIQQDSSDNKKINFYDKEWSLESDPFKKTMIVPEVTISYYDYSDGLNIEDFIKKMFDLEKYTTLQEAVEGEIDINKYGQELIDGKNVNYLLLGAESSKYFYFIPLKEKRIIVFSIFYNTTLKYPNLLSTFKFIE